MELGNHIDALIATGAGVVTSILAWRKGKQDVKSTELDNVAKAVGIWQDTAEDLKQRLTDVDEQLAIVKKNHEDCEASKVRLEKKVDDLSAKVTKLENGNY